MAALPDVDRVPFSYTKKTPVISPGHFIVGRAKSTFILRVVFVCVRCVPYLVYTE